MMPTRTVQHLSPHPVQLTPRRCHATYTSSPPTTSCTLKTPFFPLPSSFLLLTLSQHTGSNHLRVLHRRRRACVPVEAAAQLQLGQQFWGHQVHPAIYFLANHVLNLIMISATPSTSRHASKKSTFCSASCRSVAWSVFGSGCWPCLQSNSPNPLFPGVQCAVRDVPRQCARDHNAIVVLPVVVSGAGPGRDACPTVYLYPSQQCLAFRQFAASSATRIHMRQRQNPNPKPQQTLPPSPLTGRYGSCLGSIAHHNSHRHKQLCVLRGAEKQFISCFSSGNAPNLISLFRNAWFSSGATNHRTKSRFCELLALLHPLGNFHHRFVGFLR
jgi:hypothetical protein